MTARAVLAALLLACGCAGGSGSSRSAEVRTIRIVGSDTMHPLVERWAVEFMRSHPGVSVYTEGGGTGAGVRDLIAGKADLCAASRALEPAEIRQLLDRRGSIGQSVLTGKDALSIYVNPANPVRNLTLYELRSILTGAVTRWNEVGGEDRAITVVGRPPNSGTHHFLREHVLEDAPYNPKAITVPNTESVTEAVAADSGAIGYGGMAYGKNVFHCSIEDISPTPDNVRTGMYPLARYLYLYAAEPLEGTLREFTDWVLSDAGQRIVEEVGYISLWDPEPPG